MFREIPLHPHDAALQIWFELGVAGAALFAVAWVWVARIIADVSERDRPLAAAGAGAAAAYFVIGALSFGVWQDWWLAVAAFAFASCAALARARDDAYLTRDADDLLPLVNADGRV